MEPEPAPGATKFRFRNAMLIYAGLGVLAALTLSGKILIATLIILGLFAVKTWLAVLKDRVD
jgi:hypothetical protein